MLLLIGAGGQSGSRRIELNLSRKKRLNGIQMPLLLVFLPNYQRTNWLKAGLVKRLSEASGRPKVIDSNLLQLEARLADAL